MKKVLGIGVTLAAVLATSAQASDITMRLIDHDGQSIHYSYNDGTDSFGGNTSAGRFTWLSMDDNEHYDQGESFNTFCVEIVQYVNYNQNYGYDFAEVTEVPSPNAGLGGMGSGQAAAMSSLIDQYWDLAINGSVLQAAAFQLAAWEIVYEGENVNYGDQNSGANITGLSTQSGWFNISNNQSAMGLADQWLASLFNYGLSAAGFGFTNPNRQDQISMAVVPLPAPVALAGLGLLGVAAGRRRFARKLVA